MKDDRSRPVIDAVGGDLARMATEGEEALIASGLPLFQRGNTLVRPIIAEVDASHERRTKVVQLHRINSVYLRDILCRTAHWRKWDGTKHVTIDAPVSVAVTILARAGEWSFPPIAGVISTPTMRPDGSILEQEGLDPATRMLLVAPPVMPTIPARPTRGDALVALALLKDLLVEFPFVGPVDHAVALSAIITPVVRGAFPVAPMHSAKAPVAGSGKSYLFDVAAATAIGQIMPVMAAGASEEELEKRLGAALMTGQPMISIDNVNGELKGDALSQAIERPVVDFRILGKSERVRIEARGTTMFCTGNNITIVGDLCRRVISTVLDPMLERPELREFKSDPVARVLANRGLYIAAALTICRAYVVAGRPGRAKRLASFGAWSDTVRSALIWLGEADVVDSMEVTRADDPERTELNEMLSAWADVFGVGKRYRQPLAEVIKVVSQQAFDPELQGAYRPAWPRLNAAIQAAASRGRDPANVKRLGVWLRSRKGRVVGRYRFANDYEHGGELTYWWVETRDKEEKEGRWCGL